MLMSNTQSIQTGIDAVSQYLRQSIDNLEVQQAHCCASTDAVAELESKLRQHYQMKHALCVSNATTALFLLGFALELKNCDFVTTPFTYGATVGGMLMLGNHPLFADVDLQTLALDPIEVKKAITPKTKAIISVDIFGVPADSLALRRVADEHNLWYISDSSQSMGAKRGGVPAGSFADALVVSFTAGKTLFAGEGGAIITNNTELYEKLVYWSQHPLRQRRELGLYIDNEFAFNGRISPLSAVWANAMFEIALENLKSHQNKCFDVIKLLAESALTKQCIFERENIEPTFFRLISHWQSQSQKVKLIHFLFERGIKAKIEPLPIRLLYHQALMQQNYLRKKNQCCPNAENTIKKSFVLNFETL